MIREALQSIKEASYTQLIMEFTKPLKTAQRDQLRVLTNASQEVDIKDYQVDDKKKTVTFRSEGPFGLQHWDSFSEMIERAMPDMSYVQFN